MRTKFAVFFSVDGGVGKTTLALATAFEKERVLVIDADWEKADLSSIFGVPKRPGWLAGHYGKDVYLHKVRPNLYVVPGYEAAMLYQSGKIGDAELFEAVYETLSALPDAVAEERLPVDTVIVDTPKAFATDVDRGSAGEAESVDVLRGGQASADEESADVKTQIYGRYMRYASLIVANMLEKGDEKAPGIRMVNAFLTRVKMPSDYSAERIHRAVLGDRRNKEAISTLVRWIKAS
jgi:ATPases involved in chromosome partitioning